MNRTAARALLVPALAVTILAPALVAAPSASAADGPTVMYVDTVTRALATAGATGGPERPASLLPDAVEARSFSASDDGSVLVIGTRSGPHRADGFPFAHYGVWVTTPAGSRIVSSTWDTRPSITADGATVVWTSSGLFTGTSLLRHDVASGVTSLACDACLPTTLAGRFASVYATDAATIPGGTRIAVSLVASEFTGEVHASQLLVLDVTAGGVATRYSRTVEYSAPGTRFDGFDLGLSADGATMVDISAKRATKAGDDFDLGSMRVDTVDLAAAVPGSGPWAAPTATALTGYYGPAELGGTWYLFTDDTVAKTTSMVATTDFSTVSAPWVRADGSHSAWYAPVSAAPTAPLLPAPQASTERELGQTAKTVRAGARLGFDPYALYQPATGIAGLTAAKSGDILGGDSADGVLQSSLDGRTWTTVRTAPGDVAGDPYDVTVVPTRSARYRFAFSGSANLAASTSAPIAVTVVATVTVAKKIKAGKTTVSGRTSRTNGTAVLQRAVGARWVKVATAPIGRAKGYTFGARSLAHGTYRVITKADAVQASGTSAKIRL